MADKNIKGRYLNPLTDYGFKKVFGEKDIMIAFLTDLLNPISPIEDVIFLDKEMEADGEDMRSVIYDLRCKTQDGGEFIVEMQNKEQKHFSNRILYYFSHTLSEQGEERRKYFKSLNKYRTNLSVMEYAIEEGVEEGERKRTIEIARNLKTLNVPVDTIVKSTGLSVTEIENL